MTCGMIVAPSTPAAKNTASPLGSVGITSPFVRGASAGWEKINSTT
ncbi:Uncharacterised protein [Klebsiella pneumoniae]|nr:Uncharacterised protein [Klebsiella pneumoniae]SSN10666.1 Uncharacterised protein [Klebsiella pneumoniae]